MQNKKELWLKSGGTPKFENSIILKFSMKKTSKEWYESIPKEHNLIILDPDGWDRINYEYSFNEELITKNEFDTRLGSSTIKCNHSFFTYNS